MRAGNVQFMVAPIVDHHIGGLRHVTVHTMGPRPAAIWMKVMLLAVILAREMALTT